MTNLLGGCIGGCMPLVSGCQSAAQSGKADAACEKAVKSCMKCSQPHFKKMAQCLGSTPGEPDIMQTLDKLEDEILQGKLSIEQAGKEVAKEGDRVAEEFGIGQ
uniref:Uncharacterized protein n=1 Tax=Alexandrium andersonii TaxID=327968 RepID=A0A7S2B4G0_9DINO|mmetsp:Transcript_21941/g.50008  ORF Transcript_21941/g.50008 Transcript_21941/m.50008 type:complete len:104 (+) Transcript_21941:3-314(+)